MAQVADRARIRSVERLGQPERPRQQRPVNRQLWNSYNRAQNGGLLGVR